MGPNSGRRTEREAKPTRPTEAFVDPLWSGRENGTREPQREKTRPGRVAKSQVESGRREAKAWVPAQSGSPSRSRRGWPKEGSLENDECHRPASLGAEGAKARGGGDASARADSGRDRGRGAVQCSDKALSRAATRTPGVERWRATGGERKGADGWLAAQRGRAALSSACRALPCVEHVEWQQCKLE